MKFYVMTLFPELIMQGLSCSITGRALEKGAISVEAVNIRSYTKEKHGHCDDYPYGGGAGMVMQAQPICDCYEAVLQKIEAAHPQKPSKKCRVIYLTPQGKVFNQKLAEEYAKEEELIFLCGHYEGVDERALELLGTENVSIGDFVLTGGELPAMMMIDCIARLVPGVLGKEASAEIESFHDNLLEYPQYTRPEEYRGLRVPSVLLSGHHQKVEEWRREQSIERTLLWRPDLIEGANLSKKEQKYLEQLRKSEKTELS